MTASDPGVHCTRRELRDVDVVRACFMDGVRDVLYFAPAAEKGGLAWSPLLKKLDVRISTGDVNLVYVPVAAALFNASASPSSSQAQRPSSSRDDSLIVDEKKTCGPARFDVSHCMGVALRTWGGCDTRVLRDVPWCRACRE